MEETEKPYKKFLYALIAVLLLLVFILAGLRLLIKSDWFFDRVRNIAVQQVNEQLNGTVEVESIRGDLLKGFTIYGVTLRGDDLQHIATIDSASVRYSLLSIIRSPHRLDEFTADGVVLTVSQDADSVWNVARLVDLPEDTPEAEEPLAWAAESIKLNSVNVSVISEQLFPDGKAGIADLQAEMSLGSGSAGFFASLKKLNFSIIEERLVQPVDVNLTGAAGERRVTLETLVVNTGRTLLEGKGTVTGGEQLDTEFVFSPLAWEDLFAYSEDLPLQQDLQIELGAEGSLSDLRVFMSASSPSMQDFSLSARAGFGDDIVINSFELSTGEVHTPNLTGIAESPVFGSILLSGSGILNIANPENAEWTGQIRFEDFHYDEYLINHFSSDYSLSGGEADMSGEVIMGGEMIGLQAAIDDFMGEKPGWRLMLNSENMNLANWLQNPDMESDLNIRADLQGSGTDPENFTADAELAVTGNRFGDQPFSEIRFTGSASESRISGLLTGRFDRSKFSLDFETEDWTGSQVYSFDLAFSELNLEELSGIEEFPTWLTGSVKGSGTSFDPEKARLRATAALDSSVVNHEEIQALKMGMRVENQFFYIDEGFLESPIADADFTLRQHISDFTDRDNNLAFNVTLKDLQPLAVLFGFGDLRSEGSANGSLARGMEGELEFSGGFELNSVMVDTLFSADSITGIVDAKVRDEPVISTEIDFKRPVFSGIEIQDLEFIAEAEIKENETTGTLGFRVYNGDESSLTHGGSFRVDSTSYFLRTELMEFRTRMRSLELTDPFDLHFADDVLRVDTLTIRTGDDDAYLKLWAPHVDTLKQHAGLDARNLNIGELQSTILEETFFEGMLSGAISVYNSPEELEVSAFGLLSGFKYEAGEMDSLRFDAKIEDEWLDARFEGWNLGNELLSADLRIPFLPGDPLTFDDQFFDREIAGQFTVSESDLGYWLSFLPENGTQETEGKITINSRLGGSAGNPELDGHISVNEGLFSGIRVDSIGVDISYQHDNENVELVGLILAESTPVFDFEARLPFYVDLRKAEINLPSDEDSVYVSVKTDDFDLALFNNYVDRNVIRQLGGRLNGEVSITGPISDLATRGSMNLTGGTMRMVEAGITLTEISSQLDFTPDLVELQQFSMRSGPGRLQVTGSLELDNLTPGMMNLDIRGNQFRIANTTEYNAVIDLIASLEGTIEEPRLRGSLTFLNGFVNLQNFGDHAVEDVVLEDEEEPESFEFYDAMAIDMDVRFARQFFIRNRQFLDMEFELIGQVDLQKERDEELQMFGTLEGVRGFARPLGKNFILDEAVVSFFGPIDNPQLNIRTRYEPPQAQAGVRIYYIIEETLQDPTFRFDSEPELELEDIISYTLFGKPFYELESWEQVVAGSGSSPTAADIALDVLLDRVEMLASQRLGIDVVQIDNTRSGSGNTTSIKTGWYLNQKTFFAIVNEISGARPKSLFILEYLLRDNLELIITQGDDSREGVDLRWKYDY